MKNYIEEVYNKVSIAEGQSTIENYLFEVYIKGPVSMKDLSVKLGIPIPLVTAIKKEFIKEDILVQKGGVIVSEKGKDYVENQLGYKNLDMKLYNRILEDDYVMEVDFSDELKLVSEYLNNRPTVDVTIDQSKCTPETSFKRALLALKNNSLIGKRILCIGDDDLITVAMALLLKRLYKDTIYSKADIHVADIDKRILDYISSVASKEGLRITLHHHNLKEPFSNDMIDSFDAFFTDPPYTISGMNLFLSRGVSALKKQPGRMIFFSFGNKSPKDTWEMQNLINRMGLNIINIIPRFNKYEGAQIIGGVGQMIVLSTTEKAEPIIKEAFNDKIYTGEFRVTERNYQCKECGEVIVVGYKKDFLNIEQLKEKGCPKCLSKSFDLKEKKVVKDN